MPNITVSVAISDDTNTLLGNFLSDKEFEGTIDDYFTEQVKGKVNSVVRTIFEEKKAAMTIDEMAAEAVAE